MSHLRMVTSMGLGLMMATVGSVAWSAPAGGSAVPTMNPPTPAAPSKNIVPPAAPSNKIVPPAPAAPSKFIVPTGAAAPSNTVVPMLAIPKAVPSWTPSSALGNKAPSKPQFVEHSSSAAPVASPAPPLRHDGWSYPITYQANGRTYRVEITGTKALVPGLHWHGTVAHGYNGWPVLTPDNGMKKGQQLYLTVNSPSYAAGGKAPTGL